MAAFAVELHLGLCMMAPSCEALRGAGAGVAPETRVLELMMSSRASLSHIQKLAAAALRIPRGSPPPALFKDGLLVDTAHVRDIAHLLQLSRSAQGGARQGAAGSVPVMFLVAVGFQTMDLQQGFMHDVAAARESNPASAPEESSVAEPTRLGVVQRTQDSAERAFETSSVVPAESTRAGSSGRTISVHLCDAQRRSKGVLRLYVPSDETFVELVERCERQAACPVARIEVDGVELLDWDILVNSVATKDLEVLVVLRDVSQREDASRRLHQTVAQRPHNLEGLRGTVSEQSELAESSTSFGSASCSDDQTVTFARSCEEMSAEDARMEDDLLRFWTDDRLDALRMAARDGALFAAQLESLLLWLANRLGFSREGLSGVASSSFSGADILRTANARAIAGGAGGLFWSSIVKLLEVLRAIGSRGSIIGGVGLFNGLLIVGGVAVAVTAISFIVHHIRNSRRAAEQHDDPNGTASAASNLQGSLWTRYAQVIARQVNSLRSNGRLL